MNTYSKYCPNVFLAKCTEQHQKGEIIQLQTKYGKENNCIVFNLIYQKDGFFYYSFVREDGFDSQEWAKRRAERLQTAALNASKRSNDHWRASNKDSGFLSLGEPIKVGHHSERRHRKAFEMANNNMRKCVEESQKSDEYLQRVSYWEQKANSINLSMPESLEFFEFQLEKAKIKHENLKNGTTPRDHSFSLTYANKEVKEIEMKLEIGKKLWA